MVAFPTSPLSPFDGFAFDPRSGVLCVNGAPIRLRPKAADVLHNLLQHAGTLVTRQDLLDAVGPGIADVDDGPRQCVTGIRQAPGPDGQEDPAREV
jgi:DNA-binding winged helix-turn-helix (wHTH) protein